VHHLGFHEHVLDCVGEERRAGRGHKNVGVDFLVLDTDIDEVIVNFGAGEARDSMGRMISCFWIEQERVECCGREGMELTEGFVCSRQGSRALDIKNVSKILSIA
jgi:hypothetical protein